MHTSKAGTYNVLITASRADYCAVNMCPQAAEYTTIAPIIEVDEEKEMSK